MIRMIRIMTRKNRSIVLYFLCIHTNPALHCASKPITIEETHLQ